VDECKPLIDGICDKHRVEKIETIGDAYLAATGCTASVDDFVITPKVLRNSVSTGNISAFDSVNSIRQARGSLRTSTQPTLCPDQHSLFVCMSIHPHG
jgi:hypothetical protein